MQERHCHLPSGIRLCYQDFGNPQNPALLLIAGLGLQMIYWPKTLIQALVARGFYVVVFDNRDAGRSTRIAQAVPSRWQQLRRKIDASAYDLTDMATDTLGLMNHLNLPGAHLVGMSMGGMIAQNIAALAPERVLTLISIFSSTGARNVGQPTLKTLFRLAMAPAKTAEQYAARYAATARYIGGKGYPMSDQELHTYAHHAWQRGEGRAMHAGVARQIGAIFKSADRTSLLNKIQAPTLVVHGARDPMVAPSGGVATANAIAGAKRLTINGLGHYLPESSTQDLLGWIGVHTA